MFTAITTLFGRLLVAALQEHQRRRREGRGPDAEGWVELRSGPGTFSTTPPPSGPLRRGAPPRPASSRRPAGFYTLGRN